MAQISKHVDTESMVVILITLLLFIGALFSKGITHDLFLEAAVFLVSVKIIMLSYRAARNMDALKKTLDKILTEIKRDNH